MKSPAKSARVVGAGSVEGAGGLMSTVLRCSECLLLYYFSVHTKGILSGRRPSKSHVEQQRRK